MAIKPMHIISVVIALLLVGIMLPIGLDSIQSADFSQDSDISTYNLQTGNTTHEFSAFKADFINITIDFDLTEDYEFKGELFNSTDISKDSDTSAVASLEITHTVVYTDTFTINVTYEIASAAAVEYNITINCTTFVDSDTAATMNTLVVEVIPILAIVGIVMAFMYTRKSK